LLRPISFDGFHTLVSGKGFMHVFSFSDLKKKSGGVVPTGREFREFNLQAHSGILQKFSMQFF
jgi:hypothetical protein